MSWASNLSQSGLFVALYIVVHVYGVGLCCLMACIVWICYLFHSMVSDAFYATSGRTLGNARELVACRGSSASKALPEDANVPSYTVPYNYSNGRVSCVNLWQEAQDYPARYPCKRLWPQRCQGCKCLHLKQVSKACSCCLAVSM